MTTEKLYDIFLRNPSVQTDTRKLKNGDIFFALSGPNFNGNQFAKNAIEAGASYAIVDEDIAPEDSHFIRVDNVLTALQLLAKHHREQFSIPFIAITGSNGKTTTKELVSAVLTTHYKTSTTEGNLNNHIGIPLTLLRIKKDAELAVIEMGANHQKEIEGYCIYTQPTHGIITNCGKAHLEGFGGIEGVRKGKGELFDYLKKHDGTAFIFNDYEYLQQMSEGMPHIKTYSTTGGDITGKALPSNNFLEVHLTNAAEAVIIKTKLVGDYNLPNVLCAVVVGQHFKVPLDKIVQALENYTPTNSRSQMLLQGTNHIILDAYNANPSSMKLAIENMAKINADYKVLMLGGMMELGDESLQEHESIIDVIRNYNWDKVVLVGGDYEKITHPFTYFNTSDEAAAWFKHQSFQDTYILVKGSRSIQMEKVLE